MAAIRFALENLVKKKKKKKKDPISILTIKEVKGRALYKFINVYSRLSPNGDTCI